MNKNGNRFSPEIRSHIRGMFESGMCTSIEELHKSCTKLFNPAPSLDTLKKWAADEAWNKHTSDEEVKENTRKSYAEYLADLGYDQKKKAQLVADGLDAYSKLGEKIVEFLLGEGVELSERIQDILKRMTPDLKTRLEYLKEAFRLTGDYATEKHSVNINGKVTVKDRVEGMTEDEIEKELERMRSKRGLGLDKKTRKGVHKVD